MWATLTVAAVSASALDSQVVAQTRADAVVTIFGTNADNGTAVQSSGCCLAGTCLVLTTAHQVAGVQRLEARFRSGKQCALSVLEIDPDRELALLQLAADPPSTAPIGDARLLQAGSPLVAIAAPKELAFSVTNGIVSSADRLYKGYPALQTTLPANPGSSGGAVFDASGAVVGVIVGKLRDVDGATVVVPINNAFSLLQRHGVVVPQAVADPAAAPVDEVIPAAGLAPWELRALAAYNSGVAAQSPKEKIERYRRAVTLLPEFFEAWYNLGVAYSKTENYDSAAEAYLRATRAQPDQPLAYRGLGRTYLALGRIDDAEEAFAKAVAQSPNNASYLNDLGEAERRLGKLAAAKATFEKALTVDPEHASTYYNLALVCSQLGRNDEAAQHLRQYLTQQPNAADADTVRTWIRSLEPEDSGKGSHP